MTQVDFHSNVPDRLLYSCRMVRRIHRAGRQVLVWCDDPVRLDQFDKLLWTFSDRDFIPHVAAGDPLASETPVLLAAEPVQTGHHDVMLNLGDRTPPTFSRYDRLIEIVSTQEDDRRLARERFRFYRDRGYPLKHHDAAQGAENRDSGAPRS